MSLVLVGCSVRPAPQVATTTDAADAASTAAFVANGHVSDATLNFEQGFDRFVVVRGANAQACERTRSLAPHDVQQVVDLYDEDVRSQHESSACGSTISRAGTCPARRPIA